MTGSSQQRLFKGESWLTNLTSSDEMPDSGDKGTARSQALGLKDFSIHSVSFAQHKRVEGLHPCFI